jgi:hypothetical protein
VEASIRRSTTSCPSSFDSALLWRPVLNLELLDLSVLFLSVLEKSRRRDRGAAIILITTQQYSNQGQVKRRETHFKKRKEEQ